MKHIFPVLIVVLLVSLTVGAQDYRWQQRVEYKMDVTLDVHTHRVTGKQNLVYYNNSKDTLTKVYYHLFFNAFQPGSMMDVRSRNLPDPDRRVMDRISKLTPEEIGYQHILSLKQDGIKVKYTVDQTVLEVVLDKPILPGGKSVFDMNFESQVPLQVRRSGRDNREGIAFTMTQWYPKLAEYDFQGWHADQYVAREFHGVWGDFDVNITLDPKYIVAGTGHLQNADKIGYGYEAKGTVVTPSKNDLTWHFTAKDVIDFAWAADPDFTHDKAQVPGGPELHFFYQKSDKTEQAWKDLAPIAVRFFEHLNSHFGKYPFDTYSFIQGGDGGMEYPMCTMILGNARNGNDLAGLAAHEATHSWYQSTLASNESQYAWMDEGFTDFASGEALAAALGTDVNAPHAGSYAGYFRLVSSGKQEPASQHSDHFNTNGAYSVASYGMGAIMLQQLKYIIGDAQFYRGMMLYYNTWKMHHPEPNDFIRVMEKVSGLQLHWYLRYWIGTTKHIDYAVTSAEDKDGATVVTLTRAGEFPMPIDLLVTYADGTKESFYIPLNETLGKKPVAPGESRTDLDEWYWTSPTYSFTIAKKTAAVKSIAIDPLNRMADVDKKNNLLER